MHRPNGARDVEPSSRKEQGTLMMRFMGCVKTGSGDDSGGTVRYERCGAVRCDAMPCASLHCDALRRDTTRGEVRC